MPIPPAVLELVDRFRRNRDAYKSVHYNETQLRREFVDPLFVALGWDVDNRQGFTEAYKDVVHEDSIRIDGGAKSPDYSFRIGGVRKFFVETKKPSVNLRDDPNPAYQLRRYAWSAKLPVSILTDFEEFVVYDTQVKPNLEDKASAGRVAYITYEQYAQEWDGLVSLFSPDGIRRGELERYTQPSARRKGTVQVDDAFLIEMETWRESLAKNIALRNQELDVEEVNRAVQTTIDRVVFLRIAEDRGLEEFGRLRAAMEGTGVYAKLLSAFNDADARYNSGLFHFAQERGRTSEPDRITPQLEIDDRPLKDLIGRLYYPDSPYEFSVLPSDILGQVYERFLGKVIRLTAGHRAVVEPKPEVRRAGGVYYTPTYIVEYIVKRTIGPLLHGRKPARAVKQGRRSADIRLVDPACGSGSFLLGAYQYLLDWHRDWYTADGPEKWAKATNPPLYKKAPNDWQLTTSERKRILLQCIFGVDIDAQAVEVTKLSLLLKVLEGETQQTIQTQLRLFHTRALPDLDNNIKRGNSLIEHDYYAVVEPELGGSDDGIHAFDWATEFPLAMERGGFDAVVGNPPYDVMEKQRGAASWPHEALSNYVDVRKDYEAALGGKLNLFRFFIVRALSLVRPGGGRLGVIVPLALLADISCGKTRRYLLRGSRDLLADCFPQKDNANRRVFRDAKLSTVVITAERPAQLIPEEKAEINVRVYPWNSFADSYKASVIRLQDTKLIDESNTPIPLVDGREWELCQAIHRKAGVKRLGDFLDFEVTRGEINQTVYRDYITDRPTDVPMLKGAEVAQYFTREKLSQGEREWFDERKFLRANPPKPARLRRRIATQRITGVDEILRIVATIVEPPLYFADSTNAIVATDGSTHRLEYLLGILNSKLMQWRFKLTSTNNNVGTNELESLPIRIINFGHAQEREAHDSIVKLVERAMATASRTQNTTRASEREALRRQFQAIRQEIDTHVYSLYRISKHDRTTIEGVNDASLMM